MFNTMQTLSISRVDSFIIDFCLSISLQSLTFVVFDADIARKFRKTAQQIIHPPMPPFLGLPQPESDSGSDQDDNGDDNDDDNDIDNDDGNDDDNDDAVACNFIPVASDDDRANSGSDGSDGDSLSFFNLDDEKDQGKLTL